MRILAIGCHPDDLEIGCGGTLAKYVKEGHTVVMCHITNGDMGHVIIQPPELRVKRIKEAQDAAAVLGVNEVYNIDVGDLKVESSNENITRKVTEVIRFVKPDALITHGPDDYMRDHVETGKIVFNASFNTSILHYGTQSPAFPGNGLPIYYMDNLAGVNFLPTEYVDISETIELKLEALNAHASQVKWMLEHDKIDFIDFVRTCSKFRGLQCGVPYAEGFRSCMTWPRVPSCRYLP